MGQNFAQSKGLAGADLLGYAFRKAYEDGRASPARAFILAKDQVRETNAQMLKNRKHTSPTRRAQLTERVLANEDALHFKYSRG